MDGGLYLIPMFMNIRTVFLVIALLAFGTFAKATTHIIKFGQSLGFIYQPSELVNVAIGDTIQWEGFFTFHPLLATQLPETAPEFHFDGVDTIFTYVPQVNGEYKYICTAHEGMGGRFVVGGSSVDVEDQFALTAFPNPTSDNLSISFSLTEGANARIAIIDIHGKQVAMTTDAFGTGRNTASINITMLPVGVYYYRLETPEGTAVRKFTVSR